MSELAALKEDLQGDIGEVKSAVLTLGTKVDNLGKEFQSFLVSNIEHQTKQNGKIDGNRALAESARREAEAARSKAEEAKAFARKILLYILAGAAVGGGGIGASKAAAIAKLFGG